MKVSLYELIEDGHLYSEVLKGGDYNAIWLCEVLSPTKKQITMINYLLDDGGERVVTLTLESDFDISQNNVSVMGLASDYPELLLWLYTIH